MFSGSILPGGSPGKGKNADAERYDLCCADLAGTKDNDQLKKIIYLKHIDNVYQKGENIYYGLDKTIKGVYQMI